MTRPTHRRPIDRLGRASRDQAHVDAGAARVLRARFRDWSDVELVAADLLTEPVLAGRRSGGGTAALDFGGVGAGSRSPCFRRASLEHKAGDRRATPDATAQASASGQLVEGLAGFSGASSPARRLPRRFQPGSHRQTRRRAGGAADHLPRHLVHHGRGLPECTPPQPVSRNGAHAAWPDLNPGDSGPTDTWVGYAVWSASSSKAAPWFPQSPTTSLTAGVGPRAACLGQSACVADRSVQSSPGCFSARSIVKAMQERRSPLRG